MTLYMIASFTRDLQEAGNCRFHYLAEKFSKRGHTVTLITSSFSHQTKKQRVRGIPTELPYKVVYLKEPNYNKNLSFQRLKSHYEVAHQLKNYLEDAKTPDAIYCAVPTLEFASAAACYAKQKHILFALDIQDLWPEAFQMVMPILFPSNLLFAPLMKKANKVYAFADAIFSVSQVYAKRAKQVNKKAKLVKAVYLGTDLNKFDYFASFGKNKLNNENKFSIVYLGTLGHSYDLTCIMDALYMLKRQGFDQLEFVVMGDGPFLKKFKEYAKSKQINAVFTGLLPYPEMVNKLCQCDLCVNPIRKGSSGSIINKVSDYAAAGLPVINTQECLEYRNLIDRYQCGFNCGVGNAKEVAGKIKILLQDEKLRKRMGQQARKVAELYFDRSKTYNRICFEMELLEKNHAPHL